MCEMAQARLRMDTNQNRNNNIEHQHRRTIHSNTYSMASGTFYCTFRCVIDHRCSFVSSISKLNDTILPHSILCQKYPSFSIQHFILNQWHDRTYAIIIHWHCSTSLISSSSHCFFLYLDSYFHYLLHYSSSYLPDSVGCRPFLFRWRLHLIVPAIPFLSSSPPTEFLCSSFKCSSIALCPCFI